MMKTRPPHHLTDKSTDSSAAGFTLVELALVLLIIGLIMGGLFSGISLYKNAQLKRSYMVVEKTKRAMNEFIDTYHALPGDMANVARLPVAGCIGGNGNQILEPTGDLDKAVPTGNNELTQFWQHLSCADLLNNIVVIGKADRKTWGESHPRAFPDGGFTLVTSGGFDGQTEPSAGIFMRWQLNIDDEAPVSILSATNAANLDYKYDDGNADRGAIKSLGAGCSTSGVYNESDNTEVPCYIYFKIRETPAL